jgi:hypothetical protein
MRNTMTYDQIIAAASSLPEAERVRLIQALSETVSEDALLEAEWREEIERRVAEVTAGTADLEDWADIRQRSLAMLDEDDQKD